MDTIKKQHSNIFGGLVGRAELLLLVLVLPFLFTGSQAVKGSYVVAGVKSHVSLAYGKDVYEFDTYKTELIDAVNEQGIETYDQDLFSIPRETKLSGQTVKVNVTKSLPVVINDEGKHTVGRTVFSKPEKILEQNNIKYWPEDILSTELITDPVTTGAVGQLVNVKRAPVYTILVDGKKKEVRTWETKVGTIVEKSATKVNPNDIVKPSLKSSVTTGATIKITRINYADVSETKSIDYNTVYQGSTSLALGQEKVSVTGITGSKKVTYRVTYKNGEEVSRVLTGVKITKAKRDAKILRGAVTGKSQWGPYYENHNGPYTTSFHYGGYVGRYILITNLANGKTVKVQIVDKGPDNALLDLSTTAFESLGGSISHGHIDNVMIQLID